LAGGGEALSPAVQTAIERSLRVGLPPVRVHTDTRTQELVRAMSARAVTYGHHILLGPGERPTDVALMAHEVAHVIQQEGAPKLQLYGPGPADPYEREAHQAAAAVVRGEPFTPRERTSGRRIQRLGISDALNFFADKANMIPGFRMFTIILGMNPINMSRVDASAANILRALIEFLPGGGLITQALDNSGVFEKVGAWVAEQIHTLGLVGGAIKQAVTDFLGTLSWSDIFNLGDVWERAKRIFTEPIDRIINFAKGLIDGIIQFVKAAILIPIGKLAQGTPSYDLLKAVLGEDPVTGEKVPQTAETIIGPFMTLIGQQEVWQNMQKANAIPRAFAWFKGAMAAVVGFVKQIPTKFVEAFKALTLEDIILVPKAFAKLAGVFVGFVGDFIKWATDAVWNLLEIIFEVVAPGAIPYLKKVAGAFRTILKNPIGFVANLVAAGKQGFLQFAANIGAHLKASIIEWLTGSLEGVYIPKSLDIREIIKFVLSVLGLTWQNIRQKLVKLVGEPAVKAMEVGFDIVVTLVTQGPAAAWEKIKEQLGNLKDMVLGAITDFVVETVVKKAVEKVGSLLVPGGAFIQAIISIYDTIMVFVDKLKKIVQVAMAFLDSIVAIASGAIATAAARVESTLAGLLTLAISFLAGFIGLGKIADKVMNIINTKVRAPIDKALDKVVDWIATTAKRLGRFVAQAGVPQDPNERLRLGVRAAKAAVNRFAGKGVREAILSPLLAGIKVRYGLETLRVVPAGRAWSVEGVVNPRLIEPTEVFQELIGAGEARTVQGPLGPLEQTLTRPPFNYNVASPQGRQSVDAIVANVNAAGDIGFNYVSVISSGRLNAARGFPALVSQVENRNLLISSYPVLLEALRLIEGGIRVERIRFEDRDPTGDYDVDVGVINRRGGYSLVTQVKRTVPAGVLNNINDAAGQLRGIEATRKVAVIYVSGLDSANYSVTLDYQVRARVAGLGRIEVDIVLVDDGGRRLRYT